MKQISADEREFELFVGTTQRRLLHIADLLTGDRGHAEDLVQHAYAKTYLAWRRVRDGQPEAYARRVIVNARTDWWRRRSWHEAPTGSLPDRGDGGHEAATVQRAHVLKALSALTDRERTVVVLRFYAGMSERDAAAEMGVAAGTAKSTLSRALAKLRADGSLLDEVESR